MDAKEIGEIISYHIRPMSTEEWLFRHMDKRVAGAAAAIAEACEEEKREILKKWRREHDDSLEDFIHLGRDKLKMLATIRDLRIEKAELQAQVAELRREITGLRYALEMCEAAEDLARDEALAVRGEGEG